MVSSRGSDCFHDILAILSLRPCQESSDESEPLAVKETPLQDWLRSDAALLFDESVR